MADEGFDPKDEVIPSIADLAKITGEILERKNRQKEIEDAAEQALIDEEYERLKALTIKNLKSIPALIVEKEITTYAVIYAEPLLSDAVKRDGSELMTMDQFCDRFNKEGLTDIQVGVKRSHWVDDNVGYEDWWRYSFVPMVEPRPLEEV